ncbi:hypothetical protein FF1_039804 [Malus domestica]
MITGTIKAQYQGSSHDSMLYSKPYSKKIDALRMTRGCQPSKFMQFDRKRNPKQHIAHFIETCNNVGTKEDYLVMQFVRSLKGNTFDCTPTSSPNQSTAGTSLKRNSLTASTAYAA